jgi:hypothetical protein
MEASGSGEYVPHGVAYQKAVILMLIAVKTTNLMAAVILHMAFHKSHGGCYTPHGFSQTSWQLFIPHCFPQISWNLLYSTLLSTNLMAAVIFHIAFHKSYVRCLLYRFLPQMSTQGSRY